MGTQNHTGFRVQLNKSLSAESIMHPPPKVKFLSDPTYHPSSGIFKKHKVEQKHEHFKT